MEKAAQVELTYGRRVLQLVALKRKLGSIRVIEASLERRSRPAYRGVSVAWHWHKGREIGSGVEAD